MVGRSFHVSITGDTNFGLFLFYSLSLHCIHWAGHCLGWRKRRIFDPNETKHVYLLFFFFLQSTVESLIAMHRESTIIQRSTV